MMQTADANPSSVLLDSGALEDLLERTVRPMIRNDGGDVTFGGIEDGEAVVVAHADCATCTATDGCLRWWLEKVFSAAAGRRVPVRIQKRAPYFTRFA